MTALESCKLLLALEPADPMGALFLADYLALRAQAYGWLARMAAEWDDGADGTLGMLPNFAFSLALAAFRQEQDAAGTSLPPGSHVTWPKMSLVGDHVLNRCSKLAARAAVSPSFMV